MNDVQLIEDILEFWFGELDEAGLCAPEKNTLWFQSTAQTDATIAELFGSLVDAALEDKLAHWAQTAPGLVALVLLLDQFTRNIYRGTPAAFSGDKLALRQAQAARASGQDRKLPAIHRVFLYIPFEHSESLATQEAGIACFDDLLVSCAPSAREQIAGFRRYSVAHRDVIKQFGRFPHRNAILGRDSTVDELEHLQKHGGF